jgi:hypothetical protein
MTTHVLEFPDYVREALEACTAISCSNGDLRPDMLPHLLSCMQVMLQDHPQNVSDAEGNASTDKEISEYQLDPVQQCTCVPKTAVTHGQIVACQCLAKLMICQSIKLDDICATLRSALAHVVRSHLAVDLSDDVMMHRQLRHGFL